MIRKYRDESDERVVIAEITEEGRKLREKALVIPQQICCKISNNSSGFTMDDAMQLKGLLLKLLGSVD